MKNIAFNYNDINVGFEAIEKSDGSEVYELTFLPYVALQDEDSGTDIEWFNEDVVNEFNLLNDNSGFYCDNGGTGLYTLITKDKVLIERMIKYIIDNGGVEAEFEEI